MYVNRYICPSCAGSSLTPSVGVPGILDLIPLGVSYCSCLLLLPPILSSTYPPYCPGCLHFTCPFKLHVSKWRGVEVAITCSNPIVHELPLTPFAHPTSCFCLLSCCQHFPEPFTLIFKGHFHQVIIISRKREMLPCQLVRWSNLSSHSISWLMCGRSLPPSCSTLL